MKQIKISMAALLVGTLGLLFGSIGHADNSTHAVWVFPDVWCVGHLLAHVLESEEHGAPLAISAGDRIARLYESHDHGHTHPELSPVVPTGGTKELASPALLGTAAESYASTSTLRWQRDSGLGKRAKHAVAPSGPRAPPIA